MLIDHLGRTSCQILINVEPFLLIFSFLLVLKGPRDSPSSPPCTSPAQTFSNSFVPPGQLTPLRIRSSSVTCTPLLRIGGDRFQPHALPALMMLRYGITTQMAQQFLKMNVPHGLGLYAAATRLMIHLRKCNTLAAFLLRLSWMNHTPTSLVPIELTVPLLKLQHFFGHLCIHSHSIHMRTPWFFTLMLSMLDMPWTGPTTTTWSMPL